MTWQIANTQAEVPYSLSTGIGGALSNVPPVLYPEKSAGPLATSRLDIDTGKTSFRPGPQDLLGLPPFSEALSKPAPSVSVVEAASVRISQQGGVMSISEAEAVLRATGAPEEWIPAFIAIGQCESRLSPLARGDNGNSLGWLQMWTGWARAIGVEVDALYDPVTNAKAGVHVRTVRGRFGGQGGWTCADHLEIP